MELSIGGGVKSSCSKDLQDFIAEKFSYFGIGNFSSTVGRGQKIDLSKAKVRFSDEGSDLSDSVKSLVSTVEKTAGLPRSQCYLLPRNDMREKVAFTLAEVLITLGIIGVVAAMTLPALIQNYQKAQAVSQLKKSYAVIQNAVEFIRADYGGSDMLGMPFVHQQFNHSQYFDLHMFGEELSKHLNYGEKTYDSTFIRELKLCLPVDSTKIYKYANGDKQTAWGQGEIYWWTLNDGSCLAMFKRGGWSWNDGANSSHVLMFMDINGSEKNPNQLGKDTFIFELTHSGSIIPYGGDHGNDCLSSASGWMATGFACAKKIIDDGWQIKRDYKWQ